MRLEHSSRGSLPPFVEAADRFVEQVSESQVTVLAAPTGAGKSTLSPLVLLKSGFAETGIIGVTEPRRPIARNLAKWVAQLHGSELGDIVGYQIGQERQLNRSVQLKYMTEGILLAEMQSDPLLRRYSVIMLDEVHERGVFQDLLVALVKTALPCRPDLKLVLMSATIDVERFSAHFGGAPIFKVEGRQYPVEIKYAGKDPVDFKDAMYCCASQVDKILRGGKPGDILVFLPGIDAIRHVAKTLGELGHKNGSDLRVCELYGGQDPDEQDDALRQGSVRRVILSTNIAETGVTPEGVVFVVDSGYVKQIEYVDASMSALRVVDHSQAGCDQRAGRAGRTQPGVCYRMFTRGNFEERDAFTTPEIQRTALDQVMLKIMCLGYDFDQVKALDLMDPPSADNWDEARDRLLLLGAVDNGNHVTRDGRRMDSFQVEPIVGRMLLDAHKRGCLQEVVTVAACLTATKQIFTRPKDKEDEADLAHAAFTVEGSDPLTMLRAWEAWDAHAGDYGWARDNYLSSRALDEVDRLRVQLLKVIDRECMRVTSGNPEDVRKAIASGLIVNVACGHGQSYSCSGREANIHPGSVMFGGSPRFLVCQKVVETSRVFMRGCHAIEEQWLSELVPLELCDRRWRLDESPDAITLTLRETLSWRGIEICAHDHSDIPQDAKEVVVERIMRDLRNGDGFHPSHASNRRVWLAVDEMVRMSYLYRLGDQLELRAVENVMRAFLSKQLETVGTLDDLLAADLVMTVDQFVSQEVTAEVERLVEQRIREREELDRVRAQQEAQDAAQRAVLASRVRALKVRLAAAGGFKLLKSWEERDMERSVDYVVEPTSYTWRYTSLDRAGEQVSRFEALVARVEASQASKFQMADSARAEVLSQYPNCPMCGSPWDEKMGCDGAHDVRRLVSLDSNEWGKEIARFLTNRGDEVANVSVRSSGRVELCFLRKEGEAWDMRTFKRLQMQARAAILPESLVESRDEIVEWLSELRGAKETHERALAQLDEIKRGVVGGSVAILAITLDAGGRPFATYNGRRYVAEFGDWPTKPGRWYSKFKPEGGLAGNSMVLLREAGSYAAQEEIEELRRTIESGFEGLPSELLN